MHPLWKSSLLDYQSPLPSTHVSKFLLYAYRFKDSSKFFLSYAVLPNNVRSIDINSKQISFDEDFPILKFFLLK